MAASSPAKGIWAAWLHQQRAASGIGIRSVSARQHADANERVVLGVVQDMDLLLLREGVEDEAARLGRLFDPEAKARPLPEVVPHLVDLDTSEHGPSRQQGRQLQWLLE